MTQLQTPGFNTTEAPELDVDEFKRQLAGIVGKEAVEETCHWLLNPYEDIEQEVEKEKGWSTMKKIAVGGVGLGILGLGGGGATHLTHLLKYALTTSPKLLIAAKWSVVSLQIICLVGQWYSLEMIRKEIQNQTAKFQKWMARIDTIKTRLLVELKKARVDKNVSNVDVNVLRELHGQIVIIRKEISWSLKEFERKNKKWQTIHKVCQWGGIILGIVGLGICCTGIGGPIGIAVVAVSSAVCLIGSGYSIITNKIKNLKNQLVNVTKQYEKISTQVQVVEKLLERMIGYMDFINETDPNKLAKLTFGDTRLAKNRKYDQWMKELVDHDVLFDGKNLLEMKSEEFQDLLSESNLLQTYKTWLWNEIKKKQDKYCHCLSIMLNYDENIEKYQDQNQTQHSTN